MNNNLFNTSEGLSINKPLAERMRPKSLDQMFGQEHLIADGSPLRVFFEMKKFPSMIFWGPPGVGKTTFALLMADIAGYNFFHISAIEAGIKEVRDIIARAANLYRNSKKTLLFIDEFHRFNKIQQDALLHAVEKGIIILIGATTENPSFEINSALLSRCQVYKLQLLSDEDVRKVVTNAMFEDILLKTLKIEIEDWDFLFAISSGDARVALNSLELAMNYEYNSQKKDITLNNTIVLSKNSFEKALQQKTINYDKNAEAHYDTISAFIKSLRGSSPDAALLWLAKMLEAGEDPVFIARRLVIFASEDVGNADPFAITLAVSVFQAVQLIGMPECRINLAQCATYLASCAKSNASYVGINTAISDIKNGISLEVPLYLRNAPTSYMKQEKYGLGYKYPHDYDGHFVYENYFPVGVSPKTYYKPTNFGKEKIFKERLEFFWKNYNT